MPVREMSRQYSIPGVTWPLPPAITRICSKREPQDRKSRKHCEERHASEFDIDKAPIERKMYSVKEQTHSCPAEDRKDALCAQLHSLKAVACKR